MTRPHLLVDVTQYVSHPATSGVQRTLWQLARRWTGDQVDALFGALVGDRMVIVEPAAFAHLLGTTFGTDVPDTPGSGEAGPSDVAVAAMRDAQVLALPVDDVEVHFDGYLLPEPTYRPDTLATAAAMVANPAVQSFALVYDALPQVAPWHFGGPHQLHTSAYFRLLTEFEHVACISEAAARDWTDRLRRRPGGDVIVIRPGADAFLPGRAAAPAQPTFVMIGTVEPRKRYKLAVAAVERLWEAEVPCRLEIYGHPLAIEDPAFLARLEELSARDGRLRWRRDATDDELRAAILGATAVVFLSEDEGYGLPPLEALRLGVPVVVDGGLPALEGLPSDGQVRLRHATVEAIRAALVDVSDPLRNEELRAAASTLSLPTWREFAAGVERWVADRLCVGGTP